MIEALDRILFDLIQSRVPVFAVSPTQVGFEPPNDDWRQAVIATGEPRLNLYLYDLRENLKLRSNERTREPREGWYVETPAPPVLNCAYLITAWSPVVAAPPVVEPTRDEHRWLAAVSAVLLRHRSVLVKDVYDPSVTIPSSRTLASVPHPLDKEELPIEVALPESSQERLDFWNTMRVVWRPGLKLTVSLPMYQPALDFEAPMVTTVSGDYRQAEAPDTSEVCLSIGGHVFVGAGETVPRAYVRLQGLQPQALQAVDRSLVTGDDGRFVFAHVRAGQYRLQAVKSGLGVQPRDVDVPSATGEYDLRFP